LDARYRARSAAETDSYRELSAKGEQRQAKPYGGYRAWNDAGGEGRLSDPVNRSDLADRESETRSREWSDLDGAAGAHSADFDQLRTTSGTAAEFYRSCGSNTRWREGSPDSGLIEAFEADSCISLMRLP
jgi:hypothetical protein